MGKIPAMWETIREKLSVSIAWADWLKSARANCVYEITEPVEIRKVSAVFELNIKD